MHGNMVEKLNNFLIKQRTVEISYEQFFNTCHYHKLAFITLNSSKMKLKKLKIYFIYR